MTDPMVIDTGLEKLAAQMTNDLTSKIVAELNKATLAPAHSAMSLNFNAIVDMIAAYPHEEEDGLFILINKAQLADLRRNLKDDLKYVEDFSRNGYVGTVCGVPVFVTNAVPEKTVFLAHRDAVTIFTKKGTEIEQERDANIRLTKVYARKVMLVALTDETKVVKATVQ